MSGKSIELSNFPLESTIGGIKAALAEMEGIAVQKQKIYFTHDAREGLEYEEMELKDNEMVESVFSFADMEGEGGTRHARLELTVVLEDGDVVLEGLKYADEGYSMMQLYTKTGKEMNGRPVWKALEGK
jgi:hypothetical protein